MKAKAAKARARAGRSVLTLPAKEARSFFLKSESYCRIELPHYFDFRAVLRRVDKALDTKPLDVQKFKPGTFEGVNYTIYSNKDGRYAWRPLELVHPVLYVELARIVTEPKAWKELRERFDEFAKDPRIVCLSIPQESLTKRKDQGAQILHWWHGIEQASLELALDFEHVLQADIADCYSSIYTHSIAWAMHGKIAAKANKQSQTLLGNVVDRRIQSMRHGQTNGIPQGSVLLDVVAELVLGYADLLLGERLKDRASDEFRILRYRDDYRIFANSSQTGEVILKELTEILIGLGLKLNAAKTTGVQAVVVTALKSDKRAWLLSRQRDRNLQKHLLVIHAHAVDHPNGGSLVNALSEFYGRLLSIRAVPDARQLISIAIDMGYSNPRCFPVCAAIVSKLLSVIPDGERHGIVERLGLKLARLPNSGHLEVWLQRITTHMKPSFKYEEKLCKLVAGEEVGLWNNDWIPDDTLKAAVTPSGIVSRSKLKAARPVVPRTELFVLSGY